MAETCSHMKALSNFLPLYFKDKLSFLFLGWQIFSVLSFLFAAPLHFPASASQKQQSCVRYSTTQNPFSSEWPLLFFTCPFL